MAFFQNNPNLVPIDPGNVVSNNWIVLLEANTIIDSSGELRVAKTTQERKIVKRFRSFRRRPFLVVDGYDPRIHILYFCPQLYRHDEHDRLMTKADATAWGPAHQSRPMAAACERARIRPSASFHILRHTWASLAVM